MKSRIRRTVWRAGLVLLLGVLASPCAWALLAFDDVVRMKAAGVTEDTILNLVDVEGATFDLSVEQIIALKEVGASEDFIRALMETPAVEAESPDSESYDSREGEESDAYGYDESELDDYSTVFLYQYYDPFAYYWYPWPSYYVYYSPFWWSRAGFYYGGHWSWDWWDASGPCAWYCDNHYGYRHWFGPSRTRPHPVRDQSRMRSGFEQRAERERSVWQRAGLVRPAGITSRSNPAWRDAARVRTQVFPDPARVRPAYRTAAGNRTPRGESSDSERPAYRARGTERRAGDRVIRRDRNPEAGRRSPARTSGRSRSGVTSRSGRAETARPSRGATPVRPDDARQDHPRPARGR